MAATAAPSHHPRTGPDAPHAANTLATVSRVSGTVVTKTQNLRPVSSWRAASAFQCAPDSEEELIHLDTTMRCSYTPAPNAMPRLMTNNHKNTVATLVGMVPLSYCLNKHPTELTVLAYWKHRCAVKPSLVLSG